MSSRTERLSHVGMEGKTVLGGGTRKCKGPEVGICLEYSGMGRVHCAWVEGMRKRVRGDEIREAGGAKVGVGTLVGRHCSRPVINDGGWAQRGSSGG